MRAPHSSIALAICCAAGVTHAQSSVTIYGKIDATMARYIDSDSMEMRNGQGTRLGFIGTEDLGGGLSTFFKLEHRLNIDTGAPTNAQHFFQHSYVGIAGTFGKFWMGRDFTPAYLDTMVAADPWGNATAANFTTINTGGISPVRSDDMVNYQFSSGLIAATASVSLDKNSPPLAPYPNRPVSLSVVYSDGPIRAAYGYENPGADRDYWHTVTASYAFGKASVRAFYGTGKHASGADRRSTMIAGVVPVGAVGQMFLGYGYLRDANLGTMQSRIGAGYYHYLSQRTSLYTNIAYDHKAPIHRVGLDVGLRTHF